MREMPFFDLMSGFLDDSDDNEDTIESAQEEAKKFIESTKSCRTKTKTENDVKKFKRFLNKEGENRPPEKIAVALLSAYLCRFLQDLKKEDGEEYEPQTIKGYVFSIERYLKEHSYPEWKITALPAFSMVQDVLKAKMTISKSSGKGNRPNRAMPISSEEEAKFWDTKAFGFQHPMALLRVLFWYFTMLFGLRGRNEHHQMLWGDVELKTSSDGEYLEYTERLTKTRRGASSGRAFQPRIFPLHDRNRCPVEAFKLYASKRPTNSECPKFYLAVNYSFEKSGNWYKNSPLGVHSLGNLLSSAAKIAQIEGKKIVNHSARKTAIKRLLDGGCPESYVTQLTGHKSVSSLASYSEACQTVQRKMARTVTESSDFSDSAPTIQTHACPSGVSGHAEPDVSARSLHQQQYTVTSRGDNMETLSRGAVVGKEFNNCTFNISFNLS